MTSGVDRREKEMLEENTKLCKMPRRQAQANYGVERQRALPGFPLESEDIASLRRDGKTE